MTEYATELDDLDTLRNILAKTDALLLDFDGPVCSVFSDFPASLVADHLREILTEGNHSEIPEDVRTANDPFDVFRYAAKLGAREADYIEAALSAYEVEAIATARPTPGAHQLLARWSTSGRKLAIVSNNSEEAIETYLHRHELTSCVTAIVGRTSSNPMLLKPNPNMVAASISQVATVPSRCTVIGDSESDMIAARRAGTNAVGYANKPWKIERLLKAGADLVLVRAFPDEIM